MARPTTSASSMTGAPIFSMTTIVSRPISMASVPFTTVPSARHAQDFLVGLDHLVAQGDHGLQRPPGLRHAQHHLGEVGRDSGRLHGMALALQPVVGGAPCAAAPHDGEDATPPERE